MNENENSADDLDLIAEYESEKLVSFEERENEIIFPDHPDYH
jgi:hypothetical protein